jgi:SMC interacting uncharacterized protein involved in chromosome segregation
MNDATKPIAPAPSPTQLPATQSSASALSIPDLAKLINDKVAQMVTAARTSFTRAIEVGELLKQAKDRVGHGNFEAWVSDHCQFSYRSARRYMKLADERPKLEEQLKLEAPKLANVASLNLTTAQRLLAPAKSNAPETEKEKSGKPPTTVQYKQIENDLIACLKDLREKAESYAHGTIEALKDTVDDLKSMIEQAQAKRMP